MNNFGYTAPKNTVYNTLVVVKMGREEVPKGAWHLGSVVHNVLNMRHKGPWHAFGSEHAQISSGVRLQQLRNSGTDNHRSDHHGAGNAKRWQLVGCLCREAAE